MLLSPLLPSSVLGFSRFPPALCQKLHVPFVLLCIFVAGPTARWFVGVTRLVKQIRSAITCHRCECPGCVPFSTQINPNLPIRALLESWVDWKRPLDFMASEAEELWKKYFWAKHLFLLSSVCEYSVYFTKQYDYLQLWFKSDLRGEGYIRCHQCPYSFVCTNTKLSWMMETQSLKKI